MAQDITDVDFSRTTGGYPANVRAHFLLTCPVFKEAMQFRSVAIGEETREGRWRLLPTGERVRRQGVTNGARLRKLSSCGVVITVTDETLVQILYKAQSFKGMDAEWVA